MGTIFTGELTYTYSHKSRKMLIFCIYQYTVEIYMGKGKKSEKLTSVFSPRFTFIIKTIIVKDILGENNCVLPKFYHSNIFFLK